MPEDTILASSPEIIDNHSPLPRKVDKPVMMDFPEAMKAVIDGDKVARDEWEDKSVFGVLKDGRLKIFRENIYHDWIVSDGDMYAGDWIVV